MPQHSCSYLRGQEVSCSQDSRPPGQHCVSALKKSGALGCPHHDPARNIPRVTLTAPLRDPGLAPAPQSYNGVQDKRVSSLRFLESGPNFWFPWSTLEEELPQATHKIH